MPIEPITHVRDLLPEEVRKVLEERKTDKFDAIGSNQRELDKHWQSFKAEEDLGARIAIVRSMLTVPGARGFMRAKLQNPEGFQLLPSHNKIFAALIGDLDGFKPKGLSEVTVGNLEGETLLGLACEGGNPEIIKSIYGKEPKKLFEKQSWFGQPPVERLTPEVIKELAKDNSEFAELLSDYQKPGFLKRVGSGILSVLGAPIRGGRRLIANMAQAWERRKRMGSVSVEGEQRMAMPIPGFDGNYEDKKTIYDAFSGVQKNMLQHVATISRAPYLEAYVRANTFHFLGGLIQSGHFEAAKKMIEMGYYNEASPRLFMMMNLSSMTIGQQFELLNLMLDKAKDVDQQVLITRHMLTMPGGKDIVRSDRPAVQALIGKKDIEAPQNFVMKNGQTWTHLVCEGGNLTAIARACGSDRSTLLRADKNGNRPIDFMTLETANKLDEYHKQDPNKKGSFSMAVMHSIYVRTPMRWQDIAKGAVAGKFGGAVAVSGMLPLIDQVATMGGASAMAHMGAAIGSAAMINVPIYGGLLTGAKLTTWFGRRWLKTSKAADLGLDDTLAYDQSVTPELDAKYKPAMMSGERSKWLFDLCTTAQLESENEEDGIKAVESLLESQLELGGVGAKDAIASAVRRHLSVEPPEGLQVRDRIVRQGEVKRIWPPTPAHLRSYFLTAVRMADFTLMQDIADKFPEPKDALWLDTFVRQDRPHDRGNTVMHVACQRGDVSFMKQVAEKMQEQMQARMKRAGAKGFTHTLPETTKVTAFSRAATFVEGSGGRWKSQLPGDFNPFSMSNSYGQTPAELLPVAVARKLDEEFELDANKPGSFMQVARDRIQAQEMILGAQISCALPAKIVVNIKLAHTVAAVVLAGKGVGAAHGGPVGAVLGGAIADFALGTGIALGSIALGAITGEGYAKLLKSMQDSLRGYANEMTQLTDAGLQTAKEALSKHCSTLSKQAEGVFQRTISGPEELVDLLTELATRDKDFAGNLGKAIAVADAKA